MPGGRHTTPLFDLVSRTGARPSPGGVPTPRAAKPVVRVELKPRDPAAPFHAAPEPSFNAASAARSFSLPANAKYLAVAALLLVGLLAWIGGVVYGRGQERTRLERELGSAFRDRPALTEPGEWPASGSPTPAPQPSPVQPPGTRPEVPTSSGPVITPRGMAADPRQHGLNYLALASLPRADAEAAITFLSTNGLEVIGVPVDPPAGAAKNTSHAGAWFKLYVNQGLSREQLGLTARTNLEAQVAKLGQVWQKQHRGASNFSRPGWEKFQ